MKNDEQVKLMLNMHADYHRAPEDLLNQVSQLAKNAPKNHTGIQYQFWPSLSSWVNSKLLPLSAGVAMGAIVATISTSAILSGQAEKETMLLSLVADHSRAIVADNTVEVQSSNMHTVKPWLSAKLGYSPQVVDMSANGFPLLGGRRGYLGATPIAVAVYGFQQHEIDLYVLTPTTYQNFPNKLGAVNGFNMIHWESAGLHYLAMSDANAKLLSQFSKQLMLRQNMM
jgi:anti-sigma factor RsiW